MSTEPHAQFETRHLLAYGGAWWHRWGIGLIASSEDGVTVSLLLGPFYVGIGWQA
jgi:hypothetical protein